MRKPQAKGALNDHDLLHLAGAGDEEAFLLLYGRHQGSVFRFALHMSGNRETAEEITQEVFLAMLADKPRYAVERGSLQGYLIGVARNQLRRQLRHLAAIPSEQADARGELRAPAGEELVEDLGREQELRALRKAILSLPPNYREVVVLCDLAGMEYEAAAAQLGCAVGTVRSRLHRARSILQSKLGRECRFRKRHGCPA